ncbi:mitochondrial carrier domain-containing protein [Armillaria novae-zelandiae]|uniref:Mitochondrial carrier domain-containing protein n=1 Tax=Armillaria novae-zelandiae TaxID=153914 RepID=A0AA39NXV9_9AGAR|nr:mitochondrial carrier domain-containing protein [Armillaria novae-zelandiae]
MDGDHPPTFLQSLIRLQSAQGFARAGGFVGVYKGIGSVVVGSAPGAAAFFSTYDTMKQVLPFQGPLAHVAACLIRVPTEVIKTRTQTGSYGAAQSWGAAKRVLADEGFWGFYRGFGITVMREIPFTSIQFPLYELLKLRLSKVVHRKPFIAGGVAAALTTPLDVLKTRVMLDLRNSEEQLPSLLVRMKTIYTTEGMKALFAGAVPRTLWISAGGAVFLGVYEWAVHGLMGW